MVERMDIPLASRMGTNSELIYYYSGHDRCSPDHSWGPGLRDHYVVHYIIRGRGSFTLGNRSYPLEKGQGFVLFPEELVYYQADSEDPWYYVWIGFNGLKAGEFLQRAGLDAHHPVFDYPGLLLAPERLEHFMKTDRPEPNDDLKWTGLLYQLLWGMAESGRPVPPEEQSAADGYVLRAVEFVHKNYSRKISVTDIARYAGVDRKHLHAIFKRKLQLSPQQFLIRHRMEIATEMLRLTELQIGDIARSVGYEDPFLFSRMFRKTKGEAPAKLRQAQLGHVASPLEES
ncbi:AraC family transcriptional regulator [Gorillibacterium sp. CAU 1737]|uniref:AraC family transcriptional regulator n=1 Tax=Gorillibacterium sp. CAU 1737 TaxID=3140362 RepID=UPI0032617528